MNNEKYLNCEGTFEGIVEMPQGGWFQTSKEKQTPYIALRLVVTGEDVDAGKSINWAGWLSDKAIENTIKTLTKCFGFDGDLNALYDDKISFVGMPVGFTTVNEEYNGKTRCKVKWLNPPGYTHVIPKMDATSAKTLIAGLAKKAKAAAKEAKDEFTPAPDASQSAPTEPTALDSQDDVPF